MIMSKGIKHNQGKSRDFQFLIWRLSKLSGTKRPSRSSAGVCKKEPIELIDADVLLDGIIFSTYSTPQKTRNLHLSLKQTKILATLLPDMIINISDLNKSYIETFVGVLLCTDVSGFTALCEKYNDFGKSGSEKLTATLNKYLGAMVEVIYQYGGDVVKYSGDAILSLWKLEKNEYMYSLIHKVISCALYIQNSIGVYETDVKILLKVKLGISAGNMAFSVIGDDNSRQYLIVGSPVHEVKLADNECSSGEVVLAYSAWGHLSPMNYEHSWKGKEHVKITKIIYNSGNSKREVSRTEEMGRIHRSEAHHRFLWTQEVSRKVTSGSNSFGGVRFHAEGVGYKNLGSELKSFLIAPVIQQIDADLPMEYLCEMRNITIMFVNIVPDKLPTRNFISMVHKVYVTVCSLANKAMGSVNKVSLFDKDVMILVIFGLRGFNHEGEVAACLKCAFDIKQACCSLEGVYSVSVSVTTGQAYCGVVGHPLRREYTVIGPAVNKAARLMCAYPGKVTCDRDTFLFSNLAATFFTIQEKKNLKGIEDTGLIYEFTQEKSKNTMAAMHQGMYPILGREKEIWIFQNILRSGINSNSSQRAILIKGQARIGKTRLFDEMILEAYKQGFPPFVIALHHIHSSLDYGAVKYIIKQILKIPDSASVKYKEELLSMILENHVPQSEFWYLNEIMNVNFPKNVEENFIDSTEKFLKLKKLFHIILSMGTDREIFAIDDVAFCDEQSWKLIMSVINERIKFVIMTMPRRSRPGITHYLLFPKEIEPSIVQITLEGLQDHLLATLACQIMNARAVPIELVRILIQRSNGNPGWCESFLLSLCQSNVLKVVELPEWHIKYLGLIMPSEADLKRRQYAPIIDQSKSKESEKFLEIADSQIHAVEEDKNDTDIQKRNKSSNKVRFLEFIRGRNDLNQPEYKASSSTALQIEEAYEDLRQRIQLARVYSKLLPVQPIDTDLKAETMDLVSENNDKKNEEIEDYQKNNHSEQNNHYELQELKAAKRETVENNVDTSNSSESVSGESGLEGIDSVREEIEGIRRRFLKKSPQVSQGYFKGFSENQDVSFVKSLENLTSEPNHTISKESKSSENFISRRKKLNYSKSSVKSNENVLPYANYEFSPNALSKSFTENLIEESVKLFLERKAKVAQGSSSYDDDRPSVSRLPPAKRSSSRYFSKKSHYYFTGRQASHPPRPFRWLDFRSADKSSKIFAQDAGPSNRNLANAESLHHVREKSILREVRAEEALTTDPRQKINDKDYSSTLGSNDNIIGPSKRSSMRTADGKSDSQNRSTRDRSWILKLFGRRKKYTKSNSTLSDSELEVPVTLEQSNAILPAILINPRVNLEEVAIPETFVGVVMSAFDCLRPFEQLLLKCGSIIGEKFTRKMLNAVMHNPNPFLMSEAIKRLFETRLLCCGSETDDFDQEITNDLDCVCSLPDSDIVDDSLPKYSYCHILLFRYTTFRSTLYELIPLDQKREFHIRAVDFLEREKMFCYACEMLRKSDRRFSIEIGAMQESRAAENKKYGRSSPDLRQIGEQVSDFDFEKRQRSLRNTESSPISLPNLMPNFQKCECLGLRADTLKQLINHCTAAGLKEKEMDFYIQYCFVMIILGQFKEAKKLLESGDSKMKVVAKDPTINKKVRQLFMGRLHLVMGQLHLELGNLKKANIYLLSAMKRFGSCFVPLSSLGLLQFLPEYIRQAFYQRYPPSFDDEVNLSRSAEYIGICLSLLSNIYMLRDKWTLAKLVAIRSLNILLRKNGDVTELCNAYSNAIDIYRYFGDFKYCRKLEAGAASSCVRRFTFSTAMELIAIGRLNCSALNARFISGYLFAASRLGESAVKISQSIPSHRIETYTISIVAQAMMMVGKLNKAAELILLLSVQDIWYYILSLEFILETGFVIENSDACLEAIDNAMNSRRNLSSDVQRRAVSAVYVWMTRLGNFEEAEEWCNKLPHTLIIPSCGDTVSNMISVLKFLEGDLLKLANFRGQEFFKNSLNAKLKAAMSALHKSTSTTEVMLPRFFHLCAYYQYRANNLPAALEILERARKISVLQGNILERSWISHNKKVWTKTHDFEKDYWTDSARNGQLMKWIQGHDLLSWKNYMYSLRYFDH